MGEQIEDLGALTLAEMRFTVEANLGQARRGGRDIHIQNHRFRFQLYEDKYFEFLAKIISSNAKVMKSKGLAE